MGGTGLENVRAPEQKLLNSDTSLAQNSTESNTSTSNKTPQNDKTPPTSEQEKTLFCAQSVLQLCTIITPELELIIKTWPDLSDEVRQTIMAMIATKKEEGK